MEIPESISKSFRLNNNTNSTVFQVPNPFIKEWLEKNKELLARQYGVPRNMIVVEMADPVEPLTPEQAWFLALDSLREKHKQVDFGTWISPLRVVSYRDGVFTVVGAANSLAVKKLSDLNVISDLENRLGKMLGGPQRIVLTDEAGAAMRSKEVNQVSEEEDHVDIVTADTLLYNRVVNPHLVVVVPGYFARWVRLLGPDLAWMYIAFRQAAYRRGVKGGGEVVRVSLGEIASMCGVSKMHTISNRMRDGNVLARLAGFVEPVRADQKAWWQKGDDARPHRAANAYWVSYDIPLVPSDGERLREILIGIRDASRDIGDVVSRIQDIDLDYVFGDIRDGDYRKTPRQILEEVFADMSRDVIEFVGAILASKLEAKDYPLFFTHFFLQNVLPHLGAPQAWVYVFLRRLIWQQKVMVAECTVSGGYAEMAKWVGVKTTRWIYDWFFAPEELLRCYVNVKKSRVDYASGWEKASRTFSVMNLEVPPEIIRAAVSDRDPREQLKQYGSIGVLSEGVEKSLENKRFCEAIEALVGVVRSVANSGQAPNDKASEDFATKRHNGSPQNGVDLAAKQHLVNSAHDFENLQPNGDARTGEVQSVGESFWQWSNFKDFDVNPSTISRMENAGIRPWQLVSWLIYALARETINNPIAYAISMCQQTRTGAGGEFDDLALHPKKLMSAIIEGKVPREVMSLFDG